MFDDKLRWVVAAGVSAAVAAAALALMPSGQSGTLASALAADSEFVPDAMLREFIDPGQLAAVPVGPGRVAKPVAQVLNGSEIVKSLGDSGIPEVAERAYKQAAARSASCGLRWTLLAAIGRVESNHGRFGGTALRADGTGTMRIRGVPLDGRANVALIRDTDGGVLDGDPVYDRAVGPMQFIPSTWRLVQADGNGDGRADVFNIYDAALGAARYLCTGATNLGDPTQAAAAVRRYNNADEYVRVVLKLAAMYETGQVRVLPPAVNPDLPRAAESPAFPWRPSYRKPTPPKTPHISATRRPRPTSRPTALEPTSPRPSSTSPTRPSRPSAPTPQPTLASTPPPKPTPRPSSATTPAVTPTASPTATPTPTASAPTPTTTASTTTSTEPTTRPSSPSAERPDTVAVGWAPAMRIEVVHILKSHKPKSNKPRPTESPTTPPKQPKHATPTVTPEQSEPPAVTPSPRRS